MTKRLPIYAAAGVLLLAFYACIRHARPPLSPATMTADFAPQTVQIPADSRAANEAAAAASPDAACYLPATLPRAPRAKEKPTICCAQARRPTCAATTPLPSTHSGNWPPQATRWGNTISACTTATASA